MPAPAAKTPVSMLEDASNELAWRCMLSCQAGMHWIADNELTLIVGISILYSSTHGVINDRVFTNFHAKMHGVIIRGYLVSFRSDSTSGQSTVSLWLCSSKQYMNSKEIRCTGNEINSSNYSKQFFSLFSEAYAIVGDTCVFGLSSQQHEPGRRAQGCMLKAIKNLPVKHTRSRILLYFFSISTWLLRLASSTYVCSDNQLGSDTIVKLIMWTTSWSC